MKAAVGTKYKSLLDGDIRTLSKFVTQANITYHAHVSAFAPAQISVQGLEPRHSLY